MMHCGVLGDCVLPLVLYACVHSLNSVTTLRVNGGENTMDQLCP